MSKHKSFYEKIIDKAKRDGRYHIVSEANSIKIMQELAWTREEIADERYRRVQSELELKNIVLD